ncbi:ras GEF [Rhizoclosmatium globosum]|uniref:Ras GEF n=1 Tax=Rhizoclosmatium globosum TaxID=329046 RepID=A0A1Y2CG72_9FUNG|nr:ras GEF [Rhizoclosmatium globosum]|eukprot:ORY46058.1 ras GEF [Rhizoclosmatium globosum]
MDPSLAALASAAAKSTATLAKAKKALVPCKVCHGSSFSPKPHCSDCTKCTACTNGKQIGPSSGGLHSTTSLSPVSEQVASSTSIATTSSNTSTSTGTSTSGLVKKRGVSPDSTSKTNSSSFILEMGDVAHLSSAPDTAAAVAAVSISRIKTTSAGRGVQAMAMAIKVVNGDDDDEDSSETEASQDENATSTGLRRPLSSSSLAKQQQQQSTNSSKETVAVNTAGNSISSLPTSQNPQIYIKESTSSATPRIIASSVSGSHHPAVNILSMGSGMLARKKDVVAAIVTGAGSSSSHGGGAADGKDSGAVASSSKSLPIPSSVPTGARLQNSMVMNDSSGLIGEGCFDREEFPDLVDLGIIFGTKANPEARIYEAARKEFLSKPYDDPVFPDRPPNDEIKYRILENFEEGRLETVTYSTRPTGSEFISAGDIESLVDALIFPLDQDNSYTESFLHLDPSTATQQQEAYFKQKRRQFRGRAAKVLLTWIKNHWHDFHVDKDLLDELSEFVGDLGERLSWYMTQYIPPFSGKRAPPAESAKPWGLLWEPEAFAAQLTLIDHHYFRQIRPDTYLTLLQHRVSKDKIASDDAVKVLMDYVSWFRLVSSYTASLVYKEDTVKKRTKAIKRFIKVARSVAS